jgi:uncharacterized protein YkwD
LADKQTMPYPRRFPAPIALMFSLESRRLFAAAFPTAHEQYLVELINRGRANPTAEATRYGTDLNEGLNPGQISSTPKQPLAINPLITDAARKHSQWMIDNDLFSHYEGSTDPEARMRAAGYPFNLPWTWGENIGWSGSTGSVDATQKTAAIHEDLYVDSTVTGRGHRLNLMNNGFREIGAGVVTGAFTSGNTYNAVMITEDFGSSGNGVFLTGVAYSDGVTDDDFYTPGEGLGGVLVKAVRASDSASFQATTWASGGYSLPLAAGTYTVTASGGGLGGTVTYGNVVIGSENVKRDFTPANLDTDFATIADGKLTILGTSVSDSIMVTKDAIAYTVTRNGTATTLNASGVTSIDIYADDGDDYVLIGSGVTLGAYIVGANGNDVMQGGEGPDTITAGAGKDKAYGGLGDDRVNGNGGHDRLAGEHGRDRIYGGDGDDIMEGGSLPDRLWGEAGNNVYYGHGGDDKFYSRNGSADFLYGGLGNDAAQIDVGVDTHETVEELLA